MQIIAESRPASALPYIHLGYLAASYAKPQGGMLLAGAILAIAGIPMAFRLVKGTTKRGTMATMVRLRKSRVGLVGIILLLLGLSSFGLARKFGGRDYPHAGTVTRLYMENITRLVYMKVNGITEEHGRPVPNPIKQLPSVAGEYDMATAFGLDEETTAHFQDGWKNPMRLQVTTDREEVRYVSLSAGEDGKWGTDDDIVSTDTAGGIQ